MQIEGVYFSLGMFDTKADADAALSRAHADAQRGELLDPTAGRMKLREWVDEQWWPTTAAHRPRTRELYRYLLDELILDHLGSKRLTQITTTSVERWLADLRSTTKDSGELRWSPSTVAKAYRLLSRIMRSAVDDRRISRNPCTVQKAGKEAEKPIAPLALADVLAVVEALPQRHRAMVMLAGLCGLRWGEAAGLRRRNVDLLKRQVRVVEQVVETQDGRRVAAQPKTDAAVRTVELPQMVVEALEAHLVERGDQGPDSLMFPSRSGEYLRRSSFARNVLHPACRRAGLEPLRFHDLRHAALTASTVSGATLREVMDQAGHTTPRAALRYQQALPERRRANADAVDELARGASASSAGGHLDPPIPIASGTQLARRPKRAPKSAG
ncbi:MAG: tyrosine-type recombinase/integrase [Candidatus Neomicrothrix subdominans]